MLFQQDGVQVNLKKVLEDVTEAFDEDPRKYFKEEVPAPAPMGAPASPPQLVGGVGAEAAPTPEALAAAPSAPAPAEAGAAAPPGVA